MPCGTNPASTSQRAPGRRHRPAPWPHRLPRGCPRPLPAGKPLPQGREGALQTCPAEQDIACLAHAASRSRADRQTPCLRKAAGAHTSASARWISSSAGNHGRRSTRRFAHEGGAACPGGECLPVVHVVLQLAEEALGSGVIPARCCPARTGPDISGLAERSEFGRGVLKPV